MVKKIEISYKTIIFTVLILVGFWFLFQIKDIVFGFFVALLLMTIINPTVTKLTSFRIPRTLAVAIVYLFILGLTSAVIALLIPPLISETTGFVNSFPKVLGNLRVLSPLTDQMVNQLVSQVITLPTQVARVTISIFSNLLGVITVLIFTFYLLVAKESFENQIGTFFGEKNKENARRILGYLEKELGGWARGELILMLAVGLMTFIGLNILGVPYALPLSLLAGLFEIIPNFGPIVSAIPIAIIGFGVSSIIGFSGIALCFLVQQTENYFLVPRVMQGSTGVNPVITLFALAVGFRLAGVTGAIISIPVVLTLKVFAKEYFSSYK